MWLPLKLRPQPRHRMLSNKLFSAVFYSVYPSSSLCICLCALLYFSFLPHVISIRLLAPHHPQNPIHNSMKIFRVMINRWQAVLP